MAGYIPNTEKQQREMLAEIGMTDFGELFADIPEGLRLNRELEVPDPLPEQQLLEHVRRIAGENRAADCACFLGAGAYDHFIPSVIGQLLSREEFLTAYTPYQPEISQGTLQAIFEYQSMICGLTGMDVANASLYDGASALAEAAMMACAATGRKELLVSRTVHPQSRETVATYARFRGCRVTQLGYADGKTDLDALKEKLSEKTAAVLLQSPNFFGVIEEAAAAAELAHRSGALLIVSCDPVSLALLKPPGDMGFDVVHLNLHKTFSTPHGGGGPGSGPVGVKKELADFLPKPLVERRDGRYTLDFDRPHSIGRVRSFYGNFGVIVRAYAYLRSVGRGLGAVSRAAVLNANYLRAKLRDYYELPYDRVCMHEVVFSARRQKARGVSANDVAKRLLDFGFHPPTVYSPLIVHEALMIEPTETESRETLDSFIDAMIRIAREAEFSPEAVTSAPHGTPYARFDEVRAARKPVLTYQKLLVSGEGDGR